jgi:hypothetical protein
MKRWLVLILLFVGISAAQAQRVEPLYVTVIVESAHLRLEPLLDAERIGSAIEGDVLRAVGRNADSTWWEIERPGSRARAWVAERVVSETFDSWRVPITSNAGVTGTPVTNTGLDAFIIDNTNLRLEPFSGGMILLTIPHSVTIPIVGRNQDASWLQVNYNGTVGWVSETLIRSSGDLMSAPLGFNLPPLTISVIIIPPEIQLAQVERVRAFAQENLELAAQMATYLQQILDGEIVPCVNPTPFVTTYRRTPNDIRELPELQRWLPSLDSAINTLNEALTPLQRCGVFRDAELNAGYADAINARLLFGSVLGQLDRVEDFIQSL